MKSNPYKILSSKLIYKNPWIEVKEDEVISPSGKRKTFGTVDNGEGVVVVAVNKNREVYLIKEFYYVLKEIGIQTPAGGINPGETPLEAAKKELLEEAGIIANKWVNLGKVNSLTMIIKSPAHLFLALELEIGIKTEQEIDVIKVPFDEAYEMVLNGKISLAPSCLAIIKAKKYLEENNI